MAMRWRWPPENSCGSRSAISGDSPTLRNRSATRSRASFRGASAVHDDRLRDRRADALARIEARERVLKNHLHAPAHLAQRLGVERANILPLEEYSPAARLDETQDRTSRRRLAAAEFADERQRLAGPDEKGDILDRMDSRGNSDRRSPSGSESA